MAMTQKEIRSMEQNQNAETNTCNYRHFIFDKGGKIHNGEKTISLTSGAGKTDQPLVKE